MSSTIRKMTAEDKSCILDMMRTFYASAAVFTNGSEEIFHRNIDTCIQGNPYLEGYVMEEAGIVQGYAMIAKSYSTEFGKPCIWIEDLYIADAYRKQGIGTCFLRYITNRFPGCLFRLEAEEENAHAIRLYEKCGFTVLPYLEMKFEKRHPL